LSGGWVELGEGEGGGWGLGMGEERKGKQSGTVLGFIFLFIFVFVEKFGFDHEQILLAVRISVHYGHMITLVS